MGRYRPEIKETEFECNACGETFADSWVWMVRVNKYGVVHEYPESYKSNTTNPICPLCGSDLIRIRHY